MIYCDLITFFLLKFLIVAVENFDLNIQNSIVTIVDHQDAKIKTTEALQHVISKCADNIDLFLKISFGSSVRALLTPQVNLFLSCPTEIQQNITSVAILEIDAIHFGKRWK